MLFFRMKFVLKMSLIGMCVILLSGLFYLSYSFTAADGVYPNVQDDTDFQYISLMDVQSIIDRLVKEIPEKVLYSNGPTFDIPLNPFEISGKARITYAMVRGLEKPKIKDFFFNEETQVLQGVADFENIGLSMSIQNSLEWNGKKTEALTAVRLDLYGCNLKLRGHFNGAKIWDTFVEIAIRSAKVHIMKIFRNATLSHEISDYLEENLHRIISVNRNLVSSAASQWAETGINTLLQKIASNNIEKH